MGNGEWGMEYAYERVPYYFAYGSVSKKVFYHQLTTVWTGNCCVLLLLFAGCTPLLVSGP